MAADNQGMMTGRQREEVMLRIAAFCRGRSQRNGCYVVSLATPYRPYYALWRVFPDSAYPLYVRTLAYTFDVAAERAMQLLHNCNVSLEVRDSAYFESWYGTDDDIVPFGKYRGKHLAEVYYIDAPYVLWLANRFAPENRKYRRIVEVARMFAVVHFELTVSKPRIPSVSRPVGAVGEKLTDLRLTVLNVRKQVDTYRPDFYVDQNVLAADRDGNRFLFLVKAAARSLTPNQLSCRSRRMDPQQELHLVSAKVLSHFESRGVAYTRLGYIKWG